MQQKRFEYSRHEGQRVRLNSRSRRQAPRYIVVHHTVTPSPQKTHAVLSARGLSTHYEIDRDGTVYEYLDPAKREAFHTGEFNVDSIGIDLTHMTGVPWPKAQIRALGVLLRELCERFGIPCVVAPEGGRYYQMVNKKKVRLALPDGVGIFRHSNLGATRCPDGAPLEEALEGRYD